LAGNRQARLVRSAEQLLDVLVQSLDRLEAELHDETPAIRDLWDRTAEGKWRPVAENPVSDYIKRFLERDLRPRAILAGREIEIRNLPGSVGGEETDILVRAVIAGAREGTYDAATAIIEVKGCWHPEVRRAMKS